MDPSAKENRLVCVPDESQCPVTGMTLRYDEATEQVKLATFKNADSTPLTKFKLSSGRPCLSPHEVPQDPSTIFTDELVADMAPCSTDRFYGGSTDERYIQLDMEIDQATFDFENGIKTIIDGRYKSSDRDNTMIRNLRVQNTLRPYVRPTIGWKLSCEVGDTDVSR